MAAGAPPPAFKDVCVPAELTILFSLHDDRGIIRFSISLDPDVDAPANRIELLNGQVWYRVEWERGRVGSCFEV